MVKRNLYQSIDWLLIKKYTIPPTDGIYRHAVRREADKFSD